VYKPAPGSPIDEALRTGLKDAKLFDVHKWSRAPWTRDLANDLYVELFGHPHGRNADSRWRHLVIWLNDLYFKSHRCPGSFSAISLDKDEYTCGRYNKLRLSYRHTKSILDGLSRRGYIETFRGFRDPDTGVGYRTRIRATRPLLEFFDLYGFQPDESLNEDEREVIVLKDAERRKVEYKDDHTTLRYRQFVDRYNEFLRETTIDLDRSELATDLIPDLSQKRVWRVFNNGSWVEGGRFYGPWWQTIHSSVRDCILINGKPTVEIDYRGIHVLILYAKEGLDYAKQGQGDDPYRLETAFGSDWCDSLRALAKIALLILVNASDRRSAIKAIRREAAKEPLTKRWSGEIVRVVDALVARHAAIAKHFFSGAGLRLQFDDAQIAERVIGRFLELRKPILSIHDSFVVMEEDRELLRKTMTDTAVSYLLEEEGVEVTVSLKERLPKL
jgi:hypothetical protein